MQWEDVYSVEDEKLRYLMKEVINDCKSTDLPNTTLQQTTSKSNSTRSLDKLYRICLPPKTTVKKP